MLFRYSAICSLVRMWKRPSWVTPISTFVEEMSPSKPSFKARIAMWMASSKSKSSAKLTKLKLSKIKHELVPLLKERFAINHVFANGRGFPGPKRSRGIDLVQTGTSRIHTSNQQTNTKWTNSTTLCVFLHDWGHMADKHEGRRVFTVHAAIGLCKFTRRGQENSSIRPHSRINKANIFTDHRNLFDSSIINQRTWWLFLGYNYTTILGYDKVK